MARAQGTRADYARAAALAEKTRGKVFKATVTPRWIDGGPRFSYVNDLPGGKHEWVLVDPKSAKIERFATEDAFKAAAGAPAPAGLVSLAAPKPSGGAGGESGIVIDNRTAGTVSLYWLDTGGGRVAYGTIAPGKTREQHTFAGHVWLVADASGKTLGIFEARDMPATAIVDGKPLPAPPPRPTPGLSPDGKSIAFVRDANVWVRPAADGEARPLTADGKPGDSYALNDLFWSPDSRKLVAFRTEAGQEHKVRFVEAAPTDQVQPKVHTLDYLKPGDRIPHPRPVVIDLASGNAQAIDEKLFPNPWSLTKVGGGPWDEGVAWTPDSRQFCFVYNQRGHQLLRVVAVDAETAAARAVLEETSKTFLDYQGKLFSRLLPETGELLWMSERDGWNHLYLYDLATGAVKRQVTRGPWAIRGVDSVDAKARTVTVRAGGYVPGQDPYLIHFVRFGLDGGKATALTEGDGTHRVTFSPDGAYLIDTFSRTEAAPVIELRRVADGKKIATLETADIAPLLAAGVRLPEPFVAKGRDGVTDIWGVIWRPSNFDPAKKWPVIEQIYAGPQDCYVPKAFGGFAGNPAQMAELGFIVVQIDGMGTSGRSKAFHDVCFKNLKDGGFPDRIAWMKAAAAKYPYLDLSRVGVYGGSAGGQNALAALLWHGDFYKAAAADCGCHDNRMDKIWWNELWMSWPVDDSYAASSNVVHAAQLTGKLLLTVGEVDSNVDPASTMQVAAALIRADKDFELVVIPSANHGAGESPYGKRRRADFFVRSLLGVEPRR